MRYSDMALAVGTATVWGLSFIAIRTGLEDAPPFLLSALRFALAAFPALLFIKPPAAAFGKVALYGLLIGVGQFGLLFLAMRLGMPTGLASLVVQVQVFFTILIAWIVLRERPTRPQKVATLVAFAGIATIGSARLGGAQFWPFALTLAAAACWALANIVGKTVGRVDALAFTVWSSLAAPLPLLAISFALEGGQTLPTLEHPTWNLAISLAFLSFGGTLFGFGAWARLLMRYPAAMVTPFALLVPVVGMAAAWMVFGEVPRPIEFGGGLLVMAGLGFNILGDRLKTPLLRAKG